MNHLNHWEEQIRRGLAHHEVTPPAMGWNKLEQALRTSAAASQHNEEHEIERQAEEKQQGKTIGIPLRRWLRPVVGVGSVAIAAAVAVVALMSPRLSTIPKTEFVPPKSKPITYGLIVIS